MRKKFCAMLLCAVLLCFAGCGGAQTDSSEDAYFDEEITASEPEDEIGGMKIPTAASAKHAPAVSEREAQPGAEEHSVNAIKKRGTLTVAVVEENPPFAFFNDDASREGLDNAIANTIAEELGLTVEVYSGTPEEVVEAVRKGRVDVAFGGFTSGDPVLQGTLETSHYAGGRQVLLCCVEDVRLYPTLASFATKSIAYVKGNPEQEAIIKEQFASCDAKEASTLEAGLRKVRSGTCAALILDEFQGIAYGQDAVDLALATPKIEGDILVAPKVMAVMEGNESLAAFINTSVIQKYTATGGLGRLMISATTKATNLKLLEE